MAPARENKTNELSSDARKGPAPREIELKLALDAPTLARIRKAGALKRLPNVAGTGRSTVRHLTTLYWDTPDHALARAGMALRVRRDGGRVIQALKAVDGKAAHGGGGLMADRAEDEARRPAADALAPPDLSLVADEDLRDRALAVIAGSELVPVFESAISRVARELEVAGGGRFEAAFDLGELRSPASGGEVNGHRQAVCEIELEHRSGPVTTLFEVAGALAARYPLRVSTLSKVKRGYELAAHQGLEGPNGAPPVARAVKAGRSPLRPGMTMADAYAALISHSTRQMAANQTAVAADRLPAGIHQMRVAIRRLRAAHAAFKRDVPLENGQQLIDRMKEVFRPLGYTRDLDIFCTGTIPQMMRHTAGAGPPLVPLAAAAQELRAQAWEHAVGIIDARAFTRLLLDAGHFGALVAEMAAGRAQEAEAIPLTDFAISRLDRRHRQVMKQAADLVSLDDEARHDLRKRIKALRYEAAFFAPLWQREDVKAFMRPVKKLQDQLGAINDAATAASVARRAAMEIGGDNAHEAAGFVGGWYTAQADRAFTRVIDMWPAFRSLEGFWHQPPLHRPPSPAPCLSPHSVLGFRNKLNGLMRSDLTRCGAWLVFV